MKKLVMTIAAALLSASVVSAQVTSANIVGYNKDISNLGYHISAMQFDNPTNTPTTVYGSSLPKLSKIFVWNGAGYTSATYTDVFVPAQGLVTKWNANPILENGAGYWVQVPSSTNAVLSGEVPMDDSITNSISAGFQLLSYPYPVDRVVTNLGFTPTKLDKIYVWNGAGYTSSTYTDVFVPAQGLVTKWNNGTLAVGVGEGFWYESQVNTNWVVNKPF